jgi:hypothetical protein
MSAEERKAAGEKGYENGIGMMSAEERKAAGEKGYENGIGMMSAEERMAAGEKGYVNGLGAMSAEERKAAGEKGYENGLGAMSAEERKAAGEKGYKNGLGAMSAEERKAASEKGYENGLGKAAKREWTEEVDASIKRMIEDKVSFAKIALKLGNGLSKNDVQRRWDRKLSKSSGITKPAVQPGFPSRITWTADADATIERMKADGIIYAEIAAELGNGLSKNDVQNRWTRHLKDKQQ